MCFSLIISSQIRSSSMFYIIILRGKKSKFILLGRSSAMFCALPNKNISNLPPKEIYIGLPKVILKSRPYSSRGKMVYCYKLNSKDDQYRKAIYEYVKDKQIGYLQIRTSILKCKQSPIQETFSQITAKLKTSHNFCVIKNNWKRAFA